MFGQIDRSFRSERACTTSVPSPIGMSGSTKFPRESRCPMRSSVIWLAAPETGAWWHSRHACALYSGPSPSSASSAPSNASLSAACVASSTMPLVASSKAAGASVGAPRAVAITSATSLEPAAGAAFPPFATLDINSNGKPSPSNDCQLLHVRIIDGGRDQAR